MIPDPEELGVAVRAWAVPDYLKPARAGRGRVDPGPSPWSLTFDTETTVDVAERLRLGTYQVRYGDQLRERGVFYDAVTVEELETIRCWARQHRCRVRTRAGFITEVFYRIGWTRRGTVIGHNLPYDLTRLAIDDAPARPRGRDRSMRGGFSLTLTRDPTKPRVQLKKIAARAAFIRFTTPEGRHAEARNREHGGSVANHRGYFVDVAVFGAALLARKLPLAALTELLQTEHRKHDRDDHGAAITVDYLDYALNDTQATWEGYATLRDRYASFQLDTPVHRVYSEASVAKAHLRQIGITPWRQIQPDVPDWLVGLILETYYGGRTETRLRHVPVPGVLVDFTAEYPTSFVLQDLWRYLIAQGITWYDEGPAVVHHLLDTLTTTDVLHPKLWTQLQRLVLVAPEGDQLPTRARYDRGPVYNVAVQYRTGGPPQWWTLADCIACKLHTNRAPRALRVLVFEPKPAQANLHALDVAGDPRFHIDPYHDDLVRRLVELRNLVRADLEIAKRAANVDLVRRLDAIQLAMKITANSIYGASIEMNVVEHPKRVWVTVHRPDGTSYRTRATRTEEPGSYFHPLLATLITAGGRLLLATAMRLTADAGGVYAFCDTDSLFIAAASTGGDFS